MCDDFWYLGPLGRAAKHLGGRQTSRDQMLLAELKLGPGARTGQFHLRKPIHTRSAPGRAMAKVVSP